MENPLCVGRFSVEAIVKPWCTESQAPQQVNVPALGCV